MSGKTLVGSIVVMMATVLFGSLISVTGLAAEKTPTEVNIAIMCIAVVEEPWNTSLIQSLERVKAEKPHGLDVRWDVVGEEVYPPDAERVLGQVAKTGKYDIIWAHSSYSDAIEKLASKYPDTIWVFSGSGNTGLGGNAYWMYTFVHEPAYLLGVMAGLMTKTDTIGAVASYPYPDVTAPLNGYVAGAKSVNPNLKVKVTYIESWFDPPKAKEATLAQIAAGADFIYAERFGPFEACKEKGVMGFGHFVDQNSLSPNVVLSSTLSFWDNNIKYLIDEWWNHVTKGVPYNAPKEKVFYLMADGGGDIAPYHQLGDKVPEKVKEAVKKVRSDIISGKLKIPVDESQTVSQ